MGDDWLIIKRGLFWRPNGCGYTGIRDEAGRYSHAYASARAESGVCTIMRAAEAPEFLPVAHNDLVIKHLTGQRDSLVKALEDLLGSSQAVHQWLTNWDVPFADDDEWAGDKKLFAEARNEAARVLGAVGSSLRPASALSEDGK